MPPGLIFKPAALISQTVASGGGVASGGAAAINFAGPLAVAGFALNFFAARSSNRAIRRAAESTLQQLNEQITRAGVLRLLNQSSLAASGRQAIGSGNVRLRSMAEGQSIDLHISDAARTLSLSAVSLDQRLDDAITQIERQKEAVAASASAGLTSPIAAGIQGALSGALMGSQLDAARAARSDASALAIEQSAAFPLRLNASALDYALLQSRFDRRSSDFDRLQREYSRLNATTEAIEGSAQTTSDLAAQVLGQVTAQ